MIFGIINIWWIEENYENYKKKEEEEDVTKKISLPC